MSPHHPDQHSLMAVFNVERELRLKYLVNECLESRFVVEPNTATTARDKVVVEAGFDCGSSSTFSTERVPSVGDVRCCVVDLP